MYKFYNPNPRGAKVGDCAVRALCKALGQDWEKTYIDLAVLGFQMCDLPSANAVWGAYLRDNGYKRQIIPNECPDCYTVADFCRDHPEGTFVVAIKMHVATIIDGTLYDSWDSSNEAPLYFFYKEEER